MFNKYKFTNNQNNNESDKTSINNKDGAQTNERLYFQFQCGRL